MRKIIENFTDDSTVRKVEIEDDGATYITIRTSTGALIRERTITQDVFEEAKRRAAAYKPASYSPASG